MLRPRFCEQNDLFPWALDRTGERKQLVVAMADPLNAPAIDEIEFTTGLTVAVRLATRSAIRAAILRYYHKRLPQPNGAQPPAAVEDDAQIVIGEELSTAERKAGLKDDLAFLLGGRVDADSVDKLEKKFWALLRVLSRKGLISKDEFARELDESEG